MRAAGSLQRAMVCVREAHVVHVSLLACAEEAASLQPLTQAVLWQVV